MVQKKTSKRAHFRPKKKPRRVSERTAARRSAEERGRSVVSSAVMEVEQGTWTDEERRESDRRILPDRRKTA